MVNVWLRSKYASWILLQFFLWRFHFKVNEFLNFFSTINFSYKYLPEAKVYLEPSRTSRMELFAIFSPKIHKKTPTHVSFYWSYRQVSILRISSSEMFCEKSALKICSKFTGEQACRSVISIKLFRNFIEIAICNWCYPVNLLHIFRTPFSKNISGGLLLYPATSLKEKTPTQVLSDEFCEVLKTPFLQNISKQLFMFYGKIFSQ